MNERVRKRRARWRERKRERERERDLYVGYCSLTAPLLNFKQEPWAEQRAEERGKGGKRRQGKRRSSKLTLEANRRQAREEVSNEIS